ncbi:putative hydrolase of the HAD superfamily [Ignavigranum ruoffiae]|uniref:Putative hydrolase of the HAD superfamily n=1 Tax=Ignavigranum ruoffiae TaxID=89093 RepID=A0A1H9B598_9LACT|nr:HAD family hydrolase [Ignavigranum ruoffiae]SEP84202.1 putative hydrolase of the HAD superfamily [Ignavigranum ruoffiae]
MAIVGFDLDDTIYNRDLVYSNVYQVMQEKYLNIPVCFSDFNKVYQRESILEYEKFCKGEKEKIDYKLDRVVNTYNFFNYEVSKAIAEKFNKLYEEKRNNIVIRPGMLKLLNYLKANHVQMFVLTNGPIEDQKKKFYNLGLQQYIADENLFISDALGCSKPEPEIFKIVEKSLNEDASNLIYIGDNYHKDFLPAKKLGWKAIYYNYMEQENEAETDCFISDNEIYEYVKELFKLRIFPFPFL